MKHTITLLLAGLCAVALAETKSDPIAIFVGGAKVSDSVLAEMRREVEATTERTGILISWHDLHAPRETSSYADIVVIRLVGDCNEVADRASTDRGPKTLGSTHTTDGRILPFGDVFCEPVRQLIRPSLV